MAKVKNPVWPGVVIGTLADLQEKSAHFFLSALNGSASEDLELEGEGASIEASSKSSLASEERIRER